jgi:hypothetical protein
LSIVFLLAHDHHSRSASPAAVITVSIENYAKPLIPRRTQNHRIDFCERQDLLDLLSRLQ